MAVIEQTVWETIPMGEYPAVIADVRLTDGMFGQQCEFVFTLEGGEFDGSFIKGWTSAKFSPKSKLFKWAQAAFGGAEIPPEYNLDTADLAGRRVNLRVTIKSKDDGTEFNKVDDLRPYRVVPRGRAAAAPAAAPGAAPGGPGAVPGANGGPVAGAAPASASGGPGAAPAASGGFPAPAAAGFPPDSADDIPF